MELTYFIHQQLYTFVIPLVLLLIKDLLPVKLTAKQVLTALHMTVHGSKTSWAQKDSLFGLTSRGWVLNLRENKVVIHF